MDIIICALISFTIFILLWIVINIFVEYNADRKFLKCIDEYKLIKPGDIYECKINVTNNGYSLKNPFNQPKYTVICKKDGWVKLFDMDENKYIQTPITEILAKDYKCTNRDRK